jgi:hypothetical protein
MGLAKKCVVLIHCLLIFSVNQNGVWPFVENNLKSIVLKGGMSMELTLKKSVFWSPGCVYSWLPRPFNEISFTHNGYCLLRSFPNHCPCWPSELKTEWKMTRSNDFAEKNYNFALICRPITMLLIIMHCVGTCTLNSVLIRTQVEGRVSRTTGMSWSVSEWSALALLGRFQKF